MSEVTVIFSRHDESGKCNSIELLKIVQSILPEVIFEELLPSVYNQIYIEQSRTTLESDVVKMYSNLTTVEHIPVDTLECPDSFYRDKRYLLDRIGKNIHKSPELGKVFNQLINVAREGGFEFLNSDLNDQLLEELHEQENRLLTQLDDEKLIQINKLRKEVFSKREDEMIDNIYKFRMNSEFKKAILFIGSGHRKSVISKLNSIGVRDGINLNWRFLVK